MNTVRANQIWQAYQATHDLSQLTGQTAGIDPVSERVWIGDSIADVVNQRDLDGFNAPLFIERIGAETYLRIGVSA